MKFLTISQYNYRKSKCSYCKGTGIDPFNKPNVCPKCSGDVEIIYRKEQK